MIIVYVCMIEIDLQCVYEERRLDVLPCEWFSEFLWKNGVYLCLGRENLNENRGWECVCVCVRLYYVFQIV